MSRIKTRKLISLALAALLFSNSVAFAAEPQKNAQAEPQDIIDVDLLTQEQIAYETFTVERGSYVTETFANAAPYYTYTYHLKFEQNNAKFLEYTVKSGDTVKKGDVLARFTIEKSEAELTRLKLSLQRTQEQMNQGIQDREQTIAKTRTELAAASDEYEKSILEITLKKLETELAQFKYRQQYSLNQTQEAYNKEYEQRTMDTIVSPVDGIVQNTAFKLVDEAVSPNETLVTVVTGESDMLVVDNPGSVLRYNMPVEVQIYGSNNQTKVTGRVVAADDAIPESQRTGYAFIQLDPHEYKMDRIARDTRVFAETVRLDDVLLIPSMGVKWEANSNLSTIIDEQIPYVTKLVDGKDRLRRIEVGAGNTKNTVILSGVEEGDTIILGIKKGG